jgi:DNA-binding NtrC family response regulator
MEIHDLPMKQVSEISMPERPGLLAQIGRTAILESLSRNNGDRRTASEELGISLLTLQYRLKEYGIARRS